MHASPRPIHWLEYGALRLVRRLGAVLGPGATDRIGNALGRLAWWAGVRRDVVVGQLRSAFPDRGEVWVRAVARAAYGHIGRELIATVTPHGRSALRRRLDTRGLEPLRRAARDGGFVVVTGHLGNWDLLGAAIAEAGVPLDIVTKRLANPLVDALVRRSRERLGVGVIPWDEGSGAAARALRAIRAGRAVGFAADQEARDAGIFVPFFGRPASTHRGPAVLAVRAGVPLFVAVLLREDDGYVARVRRMETPGGARAAAVKRLTAAYTAEIERLVRGAPDQYFWHHRRWKSAPDPGAGGTGPVERGSTQRRASALTGGPANHRGRT